MKNLRMLSFIVISVCFSAVMLVMSLYKAFEIAGINAYITDANARIEELETENRILSARLENSISIQKIDEYARERLGMRAPAAEQIYYTHIVE